ncbi:MAG TPA: hypothetical protein PLX89_18615, partial [Verrucomicrobiota bacterium]|nr:hypothetical protein [Verrucomicrobiota bacterium]
PACATLAKANAQDVPGLLAAMDGANDYALNWLRAAVETIVQRETSAGRKLPVAELNSFLLDPKHHPRARRMAYELIVQADSERARKLLPGFVNDPANELRRDAVQLLVDAAAARVGNDQAAAVAGYREALAYSRDPDQIEAIAKHLGELGDPADLSKTFGWVTRWKLIGPFDNTAGAGFEKVFPPEQELNFTAEYDGKSGKARWVDFESRHDMGLVDFNQPFTPLKEVTGYAAAEFWSDTPRPAEIRLGCKNGWKVWFNGKFLFGRDEYHRGVEIDQYRFPVELQAGRNVILVKCTQNEQTEDWTKEWEFQLRVTDAQGTPIRSTR